MNEKQRARLADMKARIKKEGLTARTPHIRVTCVVCEKTWPIKTNHPEIYTDSVRRRWMCPLCKGSGVKPKEDVPMAQSKEERNAKAREAYARRKASVAKPQEKKAQPNANKERISVAETWIKVLSSSVGKKRTDEAIAGEMDLLLPNHKGYEASDVARHRSLYNNGRIKGQTEVPSVKVERYVG